MPSLMSVTLNGQFRLMNPLLQKMDIKRSRRMQEELGRLQQKAVAGRVDFSDVPFDAFSCSMATPKGAEGKEAVMYLHGGAYTAGGREYARGFGGALAGTFMCPVICPAYRLAPEHPFPAACEDALSAYRYLLGLFPAEKIALVGESAGGGLLYALCLRLKRLHMPLPGCLIALSPWCDLTMAVSEKETAPDPLLNAEQLKESARAYAGEESLTNPYVSPLFGDVSQLPDSLLFSGEQEILKTDAARMAQKLRDAGCFCETHVESGMWHAYVLYGVPESRAALRRMRAFFDERIRADGKGKNG